MLSSMAQANAGKVLRLHATLPRWESGFDSLCPLKAVRKSITIFDLTASPA